MQKIVHCVGKNTFSQSQPSIGQQASDVASSKSWCSFDVHLTLRSRERTNKQEVAV